MAITEDEIARATANMAARIECHCMLIRAADDPIGMLQLMRPILCHPSANAGEIPPLYVRVAQEEVRRRAALYRSSRRAVMATPDKQIATPRTQH
jgi:hypothetical protein